MRIRIAMRGIGQRGGGDVADLDEVVAGVRCPWVELDGHRISDIVSATFHASDSHAATCEITLQVLGPVELVYVNRDGDPVPGTEEIPAEHADALLGKIDYRTLIERT